MNTLSSSEEAGLLTAIIYIVWGELKDIFDQSGNPTHSVPANAALAS